MLQFKQFDLNIPLFSGFYFYVVIKQMNSKKYYIIVFYIFRNTYSYVITITID